MNSPITNAAPASNGQVVVFPPDRGIGVLAVAPPYPPGFKPQNDGALGININMVHGDRDGLLVYILAYLNMAIGDSIKVYIDTKNAPVAEFSVTEAHFDAQGNAKNIPFYISANTMLAKFEPFLPVNKNFWFEIKRVGGNPDESPPVPLLYKYPAPGEADTDGGKPFNQGLKLPVASESVVDQTVINDGMFVTVLEYFNQNIGDVVVLAFGSLLLESTVTELGDVVFELTPQMLASLAPTNSLVVRWEVSDVVENSSGWSDTLILTFKPGVVLLVAPIFAQADLDNVVSHDELAGGAMVILVTGIFAKNDLLELTLQGLTKGGDPATRTFSVTLAASNRAVDFPVSNEWVRNLIGGSAHASYTLTKAGKPQSSKPADANVTGTSRPLGLPIVSPLVDNKLPVDTAMATVQVAEYWPLKKGATVKLKWQTTDQDGIVTLFIFQLIVTDPAQPIIFQVPAKYIAPYASTPLTVQCTVTNPGKKEVFSGLLQLMFGDAAQVIPTLTNVQDTSGKEIPNTGTTTSTTLKLIGKASKGKEVEIYDGSGPSAVPKGKATADVMTGVWARTITVPVGARRLYAKSLYHSSNVYSNVRTLTIETGLTLDPPVPAANPVDPLAYPLGMPIQVAYLASSFGDHAQLIQLGPLPQTFPKLPLDSNHQANFNLDARFLGAWHGKTAEFVWALIRGNEEIARSGPLVLNVNRIADGDSRLPTPIIVGQTGAELDVNKLVAGDTLSIAPWLLQVAGRYVWLRFSGFNNSGAPVFIDVIDGVPHNETQGLTRPIEQALVDWFKTLKQGTAATITFRVDYSGLRDLLTAVAFPVRTYTVKAAPDIPELIVDTSLLSLKGENYTFRYEVAVYTGDDAVGTAESRAGKGGVGTITYESLNPLVASVDSKGVVRSEGNGRTTIVACDAAGQKKSFEVVTANVTIAEWTSRLTLANGRAYVSQVGGQMIATSLTDRRVQIASRRVASFNIGIGVPSADPYLGQILITKSPGGAVRFSVGTLYADGTTLFKYWINKPAS
jgi:hypothetical protein